MVLGYLNANGELFSSAQSADIAKITVNAENATLKITDVKVSGWDTDKTVKYGKVNGIDPSEATFTDALSYDVNQDGTIESFGYYRSTALLSCR